MAILVIEEAEIAARWREALVGEDAELDVRVWPQAGRADEIEMALLWDELAPLAGLPSLKAVVVLGAGVDHLFAGAGAVPAGVRVVRLIDPSIAAQVVEYVAMAVTARVRRWDDYRAMQRRRACDELAVPVPGDVSIGVLGLGEIGGRAARVLAAMGYRVRGWSRRAREIEGVACFSGCEFDGPGGLAAMVGGCDIVICLLPLTAETADILDGRLFDAMKPGAWLINAARGGHLVEADLLAALDDGRLAGATLDVQREEPMGADHPFWDHPQVVVTPHIASTTWPEHSAGQVVDNYRRLRSGQALRHAVDVERRY